MFHTHHTDDSRHEKYNSIAESERLYLVNIYRTQHYLHQLSSALPVVSIMDGAVMGSGTMFGLNSTWSVATERSVSCHVLLKIQTLILDNIRSVWCLPEVSIAGLPDVGSLYHMYHRPHQLGTMLSLTGYRFNRNDLFMINIISHCLQVILLLHSSCRPRLSFLFVRVDTKTKTGSSSHQRRQQQGEGDTG